MLVKAMCIIGVGLGIIGCGIGFIGKTVLKSYTIEHFGDMIGGVGVLLFFLALLIHAL